MPRMHTHRSKYLAKFYISRAVGVEVEGAFDVVLLTEKLAERLTASVIFCSCDNHLIPHGAEWSGRKQGTVGRQSLSVLRYDLLLSVLSCCADRQTNGELSHQCGDDFDNDAIC